MKKNKRTKYISVVMFLLAFLSVSGQASFYINVASAYDINKVQITHRLYWDAEWDNEGPKDYSSVIPAIRNYVANALNGSCPSYVEPHGTLYNKTAVPLDLAYNAFTTYPGKNETINYYNETNANAGQLSLNKFILDQNTKWNIGWNNASKMKIFSYIPDTPAVRIIFVLLIITALYLIRSNYRRFRRLTDVIISILALGITFPLWTLTSLLIILDSPGPVIFSQVRVGFNRRMRRPRTAEVGKRSVNYLGKPFKIFKFRTMRADAEAKSGPVWAKEHDNRITRMGNILRKLRIDEIPQFLNVLRGEISVIGPRPERPEFVTELNKKIYRYAGRFNVEPGITGLAQIRFKYAANVKDSRIKLKYDLLYAKNNYIATDFKILIDTLLFFTKGAR